MSLDKFKKFLFMHFSTSCIGMYDRMKKLCGTNLCDLHLTCIVPINISHTQVYCFKLFLSELLHNRWESMQQLKEVKDMSLSQAQGCIHHITLRYFHGYTSLLVILAIDYMIFFNSIINFILLRLFSSLTNC